MTGRPSDRSAKWPVGQVTGSVKWPIRSSDRTRVEQHVVFVEQPVGTTGCFVPTCCSKKNDMLFQNHVIIFWNNLLFFVRTTGCFLNNRLILVEQPVRTTGLLEQPVGTSGKNKVLCGTTVRSPIFTVWECAQSILRLEKPKNRRFSHKNPKCLIFASIHQFLPWIRVKEAFSRFGNARNRFSL